MKIFISKLILLAIIISFNSCEEENGVQTLPIDNDKDHSFELIQGFKWSYDIANGPARDSLDVEYSLISSVGTPTNIEGRDCFEMVNFKGSFKNSLLSGGEYAYADENSFYIYTDGLSAGYDYESVLRSKWVKMIDFKELNWSILDTNYIVKSSYDNYEYDIVVKGKRLEIIDVYYNGKSHRGLKTEIKVISVKKNLNNDEERIYSKVSEIISIAGIGIYQVKSFLPDVRSSQYSILTKTKE